MFTIRTQYVANDGKLLLYLPANGASPAFCWRAIVHPHLQAIPLVLKAAVAGALLDLRAALGGRSGLLREVHAVAFIAQRVYAPLIAHLALQSMRGGLESNAIPTTCAD